MKKLKLILLHVILPTFVGGMIYIIFRAKTLWMFSWFEVLKLDTLINYLRNFRKVEIWDWVKFSLPDALWVYSFTMIMIIIWDFKLNKKSAFWILLAPALGIFGELSQLINLIPNLNSSLLKKLGTFDLIDFILVCLAVFLALIQLKKPKIKKSIQKS
jgi:hypothetical protein